MVTNIRDLQIRDDLIVTIAGTVVSVRDDEFVLQDNTGQIRVDAVRGGSGTIDLRVGEQVTVTGDLDDLDDFDATRIVRADGSEVIGQPRGNGGRPGNGRPSGRPSGRPGNGRPGNGGRSDDRPIDIINAPTVNIGDLQIRDDFLVTISGTVTRIRDDEFVLRDSTGQVLVAGVRRGSGRLDIAVGDRLTVVGDLDDPEDFDALRITRPDGSIVSQPIQSGGGGRNPVPRDDDFDGSPPWAGQPGGRRAWEARNGGGRRDRQRGLDRNFGAGQANNLPSFLGVADMMSAQPFAVDSSTL